MKIIKRLAFVLGMLVNVGMCEVIESNKIDNKIKDFCGDSGISKCISFYESSCNNGNFFACGALNGLNRRDFNGVMKNIEIKGYEFVCQNYNGSIADIEKILLNFIKYAKEIGKFLAENNVAETSSAMQEMAGIVAEEENIFAQLKTPEGQIEFMQYAFKHCQDIGNAYIYGKDGTTKNIKKGIQYLKKSCDYGGLLACSKLGKIYSGYDKESEQFKNLSLAKKYYEKACDLGNKHSCGLDCWVYKISCDEYIELHQKGVK